MLKNLLILPTIAIVIASLDAILFPQAAAQFANQVPPPTRAELRASYAGVVEKAAPAVVNIYSKRIVQTRRNSIFDNDPFFQQFFGNRGFGGMPRERVQNSLGSGVIVRSDGIVVTNNHVIEGMTEIKVGLADRREYEAELILADPKTDLAVLRIETGEPLPALGFVDSDSAHVGDIVLAIGNPFGVGQTVTSGIVSALSRTNLSVSDFQFFIQTDAAINPGNSGGALIDIDGKLLGVNTAIYSRSGGSIGIGFAIPGNMVRQVIDTALSGGTSVRRPWLGASAQTITPELAAALELDRPSGALIDEILPGTSGALAGLKEGDVIVKINGYEIVDANTMRYRIATRPAGETALIEVNRNGTLKTLTAILAPPPEIPARAETTLEGHHPLSGIRIANLSPALADERGLPLTATGVVITAVVRGSFAARYSLRENHRILSVNGTTISSVNELVQLVQQPSSQWLIKIADANNRITTLQIRR